MTFQPFRPFGDSTPRRRNGLNPTTQPGAAPLAPRTGPWATVFRIEIPEGATGHLAGSPMDHPTRPAVFMPIHAHF